MRKRTVAREYALQVLYSIDITNDTYESAIYNFWQFIGKEIVDKDIKEFTEELVKLVIQYKDIVDERIAKYATNWELERMAVVDRNIMRLGGCELLYRNDIPPKVSINEAVELAKKFSSIQAAKFVNGILDKIKSEKE